MSSMPKASYVASSLARPPSQRQNLSGSPWTAPSSSNKGTSTSAPAKKRAAHVYRYGALPPLSPSPPALSHQGASARHLRRRIDSHGDLYVADYTGHKVKILSPTGAPITEFETSANAEGPCDLAVDSPATSTSRARKQTSSIQARRRRLTPPPRPHLRRATANSAESVAYGIAVNPANDDVYIAFEDHISSYEPNGTPISETIGLGIGSGFGFRDVGVYGRTGNVYVIDEGTKKAYVLNPAGTAILAEIDGSDSTAGAFGSCLHEPRRRPVKRPVYVGDIFAHHVVDEFDAGGSFVAELSRSPALVDGRTSGIAVDGSSGSTKAPSTSPPAKKAKRAASMPMGARLRARTESREEPARAKAHWRRAPPGRTRSTVAPPVRPPSKAARRSPSSPQPPLDHG